MTGSAPALLGGRPCFAVAVPVARPTLNVDEPLIDEIRRVLGSGVLTSGPLVRAFESAAATYLGVAEVVAVNSCTTGLILTLGALVDGGEVVLPSFTFMATGHAVVWNGLTPVFADCDADTYALDPASVADRLSDRTTAVLAVHTFGAVCDVDALAAQAQGRGIPLVVDAAHGFGARYPDATMVGSKSVAEVFSLSPTKTLAVGEGGLIATASEELASRLRVAREYGNPGDYDARFFGLNGRMTEINAAIGLAALRNLPERLECRAAVAAAYQQGLADVPGLAFQQILAGSRPVYKDFTVAVDANTFGLTSRELAIALRHEGIDTRRYFDPPLHRQRAYRRFLRDGLCLPNTDRLSDTLLTLPLYAHLPIDDVQRICDSIAKIHEARESIARALRDVR